jgi:plastocyanin domain-containing protein
MMQPRTIVSRSLVLATFASALLSAACGKTDASAATGATGATAESTAKPAASAAKVEGRLVEIVAEDSGYNPKVVQAKAGETLTLRFVRKTKSECLAEIAVPSLGVKKPLPMGEPVDVVVKADKAGEIPFQCGMAMLFGKIVVSG